MDMNMDMCVRARALALKHKRAFARMSMAT